MKLLTSLVLLISMVAANAAEPRKAGDYTIIVSAEKRGESIAFWIDEPSLPQWISYPPGFHFEELCSATLEGEGLMLPLLRRSIRAKDEVPCVFVVPKSVLKGAVLKLEIAVGMGSGGANSSLTKREIKLEELAAAASEPKPLKAEKDGAARPVAVPESKPKGEVKPQP